MLYLKDLESGQIHPFMEGLQHGISHVDDGITVRRLLLENDRDVRFIHLQVDVVLEVVQDHAERFPDSLFLDGAVIAFQARVDSRSERQGDADPLLRPGFDVHEPIFQGAVEVGENL